MIPPKQQWCIQVDVTNQCVRRCANCTRMLAHARTAWDMPVETFRQAMRALKDFPSKSPPDARGRQKVVGMIGGEPLLHPQFPELCKIMAAELPNARERGLWTGLSWWVGEHAELIHKTFPPGASYVNPNDHSGEVWHYPVLVAAEDALPRWVERWDAIWKCPLQEDWSATLTPKGFFFCEVAGAFDMVFDGPGGLAIEAGCWKRDLGDFRAQIDLWCPRCGMAVPGLRKRRDKDEKDDISAINLRRLAQLGSPRILGGDYELWTPATPGAKGSNPIGYLKRNQP